MEGELRGVVRSSQPYQLWTGERRGARARTATIPPLLARMHVVTGDGPNGRKGWHRCENNLSVPLRARGSVVAFSVWVGPSFSWRETSRWDRRCQFFDGWRNSSQGHQLVRCPGTSRVRLQMARSCWSTPELYVKRKAMWSAARPCLADAGTGGNQMLRRGMAGNDI